MILLNLYLDNVLAFKDFNVNFSYPVKLRKTSIPNENLSTHPSFRYKKLNIFIGSNATGKTSLIKCIWSILFFLTNKERNIIESIMNDDSKIVLDYAEEIGIESKLKRIIIIKDSSYLKMAYNEVTIKDGDSYESRAKDLDNLDYHLIDYINCLNCFNFHSGWNMVLPATEPGFSTIHFMIPNNKKETDDYVYILNQVLKTLDPSIINVKKSKDANNAYVIEHENTDTIILQDGMNISDIRFLSSGTKYGINLANTIYSIKYHKNGIYLIDEQFSYVNSDIEASMLSTMVSLLGDNEQIFFTTHNSSILDLGFPFHSFNFMNKIIDNGIQKIKIACATEVENRNNVSPKTILDNDMLGTAPDTSKIFELGEN